MVDRYKWCVRYILLCSTLRFSRCNTGRGASWVFESSVDHMPYTVNNIKHLIQYTRSAWLIPLHLSQSVSVPSIFSIGKEYHTGASKTQRCGKSYRSTNTTCQLLRLLCVWSNRLLLHHLPVGFYLCSTTRTVRQIALRDGFTVW